MRILKLENERNINFKPKNCIYDYNFVHIINQYKKECFLTNEYYLKNIQGKKINKINIQNRKKWSKPT